MKTGTYCDKDIINGIVLNKLKIYQYLDKVYRQKVLQHVIKNSGSIEEGEEHYQDVIFEIYLSIDAGKYDLDSPRTFTQNFWLITKRRWIDKLRKRSKIITTELNHNTIESLLSTKDLSPTKDASDALVLLIHKYLRQLTEEEQEYIKMYYYMSKSLQFIADYFGTTYNYSRLKLHRIRQKIRKFIEDDPEFKALPQLITG